MLWRSTAHQNLNGAIAGLMLLSYYGGMLGSADIQPADAEFDAEADAARTRAIEEQIDAESHAFFITARLYDDGVIDPRDTRTVLGMSLSAAHSAPVAGRRGFGVFRM